MTNEMLLILSLLFTYSFVLLFFYLFQDTGLYCWTVIGTIVANIEVLILVNAFGMEQTLGNILFASTFMVTDILSEVYGKDKAQKAINIGILTSIIFVVINQSWLIYTPSQNDFVFSAINQVFSNTPRTIIVSILVYCICQKIDVVIYHKVWQFTSKKFSESRKYLWVRNNISTLISQAINSILFTFGAFYKIYDLHTILSITLVTYTIFIFTSILDTPFVYIARKIYDKKIFAKN